MNLNQNFKKIIIIFIVYFRAACSIESAAITNPDKDVYLIIIAPFIYANVTEQITIQSLLLHYPNIHLRTVDLWEYTSNTPAQSFLKTNKLFESQYLITHLSDLIRFVT